MTVATLQDILYLVGSICLVWITIFLCWTLYQIGKLLRQGNMVVEDVREKVALLEHGIEKLGTRLASTSEYLSSIVEGGKQIVSLFHRQKQEKKKPTKKSRPLPDMP